MTAYFNFCEKNPLDWHQQLYHWTMWNSRFLHRFLHKIFTPLYCRVLNVGGVMHTVWIAHCVRWMISRTLVAILPDFEFQWFVDQLAKGAIDHDIDPLTTVHYADLKPLVNYYTKQEVQIKWDVSIYGWYRSASCETNTRTSQEIPTPDQSWRSCNNPTSNWPHQGHKVPYLVPMTTGNLPALWPDADHRTHAPEVYNVTTKSWILHCWLTGRPSLRQSPRLA